jgi:hypothetical protein
MSQQPPKLITYMLPPRRSPIRRLGCAIAVILWFSVLLTPCLCLVLASQGEIAVRLGDLPGQSFRLWLLNESRQRGIGISRPSIYAGEGEGQNHVCVQTDVSFILWTGSAEATSYCECYTRQDNNEGWELLSTHQTACQP